MLDKKGLGEMMWIFMFFFLLAIIAVSIVSYNYIFYGKGYDAKESDAKLLNLKIVECLSEKELKDVLNGESGAENEAEKFFDICELNKNVIEKNFILRICENLSEEECAVGNKWAVSFGNNFNVCEFKAAQKSDRFVRCFFGSFEKEGRKFVIITGSEQKARRFEG